MILQYGIHMNKYTYQAIHLLVVCLLMGTCSIFEGPEEISNPFDPSDPDYIPPVVTFTQAPSEGETVDTCYVEFDWEGNQPSMNNSYRIDEKVWSEWSSDHSVVYSLLDEGEQSFEIKSRYFNGAESDDPQAISFTVDDLVGPALTLAPRYSVGQLNEVVAVEILALDVSELAMIKVVLNYNPARLTANSVNVFESESLLAVNGGTVIPFHSINSIVGTITIEVAVATGNPPSVSGSGGIARISFTPTSAQICDISFEISSEFRDADNTTIQISDFGNGGVYVQ